MKNTLMSVTLLAVLLLATFSLPAADTPKKVGAATLPGADEIVAKGQGCTVKRGQIDEAFITLKANAAARGQTIPEADREKLESQLLDRLIFTQLLLGKASEDDKTKGKESAHKLISDYKSKAPSEEAFNRQLVAMGLTPEQFQNQMLEQAVCEQVIDREIKPKLSINDTDVKKFYDENAANFQEPEQVRAAHVLIATKDLTTNQDVSEEQKKEKKKLAEKVLAKAKAGEDFAKLAKEFSDDPGSKDRGGEYVFPRGQMVPEFEAAAFSMKTNQISDVVTTQFGFHIIKLHEKLPAKKVEFAKVEKDIKQRLEYQAMQKRLPDYLDELKKAAKVEIVGAKTKADETKK